MSKEARNYWRFQRKLATIRYAKGSLNFHWKCMMAPLSVLDNIVVHELCYLHSPRHDETFWNELDKVLPDYLKRKEWLKKNGAGMSL
jgi:hypothetical protein